MLHFIGVSIDTSWTMKRAAKWEEWHWAPFQKFVTNCSLHQMNSLCLVFIFTRFQTPGCELTSCFCEMSPRILQKRSVHFENTNNVRWLAKTLMNHQYKWWEAVLQKRGPLINSPRHENKFPHIKRTVWHFRRYTLFTFITTLLWKEITKKYKKRTAVWHINDRKKSLKHLSEENKICLQTPLKSSNKCNIMSA